MDYARLVTDYIAEKGISPECPVMRYSEVIISYTDEAGESSVSFDIELAMTRRAAIELSELFAVYCKESGLKDVCIEHIYVNRSASTYAALVEITS